jgi:hypothetical protein
LDCSRLGARGNRNPPLDSVDTITTVNADSMMQGTTIFKDRGAVELARERGVKLETWLGEQSLVRCTVPTVGKARLGVHAHRAQTGLYRRFHPLA